MSTLSAIAAPTEPRGFMVKAGTFAAGTALAGAALLGGTVAAPHLTAGLSGSVHHDFALTAGVAEDTVTTAPTFVDSLQTLLSTLGVGDMGQLLALIDPSLTLDSTDTTPGSTVGDLLAALNPDGTTLDAITGGFLSEDLTALLNGVEIDGNPLGSVPLDALIGGFIGGAGADTSIGDLLGYLGLGDYAGLLNLSFLGLPLSADDTVAEVLNNLLGIDGSTATLNSLLTDNGLGDATIATMLGIDPSDPWNEVLGGLTLGGTLADPDGTGTLGDESLAGFLGGLTTGDDTISDSTTLTGFLGDLGIWDMLGAS